MTGGGFLGGAQMGFHMGFPDAALSGRHAVPRRILTPMLLLRLTWSEAQKVVVVADYYAARPETSPVCDSRASHSMLLQ